MLCKTNLIERCVRPQQISHANCKKPTVKKVLLKISTVHFGRRTPSSHTYPMSYTELSAKLAQLKKDRDGYTVELKQVSEKLHTILGKRKKAEDDIEAVRDEMVKAVDAEKDAASSELEGVRQQIKVAEKKLKTLADLMGNVKTFADEFCAKNASPKK